jgi:hypothetical protein
MKFSMIPGAIMAFWQGFCNSNSFMFAGLASQPCAKLQFFCFVSEKALWAGGRRFIIFHNNKYQGSQSAAGSDS